MECKISNLEIELRNNIQGVMLATLELLYCNLLKIGPPSKISPPTFLNEVVAKGAFKVRPPIYATVDAVMLSQKRQRSSTMHMEGLTNEGICCYCISKHITKEALKITACMHN